MKKTLFIKNAAILTATSILLRVLGIIFKVWLASRIGSEGIGLYHLIFSVFVLASAFASAGIPTAVTRMISEAFAKNDTNAVFRIIKRATFICLSFSLISFFVVNTFSKTICLNILHDIRALPSLKIMCFSLPFMACSAVFKSYFFARRNISINSIAIILEQVFRITLCFFIVTKFVQNGIAAACAAVILADTLSEAASFVFMLICFLFDKKKLTISGVSTTDKSETKELLRISLPLLVSRYCTSFLRTGENVLVPKTLANTLSYSTALSRFGAVKGMALPILFFPSSVLNALSALLLPEMSEAVAKNKPYVIKNAVKKTIQTTWLLGVIFGAVFFFSGEEIGRIIYKDTVSGELIKILSFIVPLMYLDSICDGILKGLDQQSYTFFTSLADSLLRIILILLFVPKFSMNGFLGIMIFSNVFTCVLHVGKLLRLTNLKPKLFKDVLFPVICAATICYFCYTFLSFLTQPIIFTAVFAIFSCVIFIATLVVFKFVDIHDYI